MSRRPTNPPPLRSIDRVLSVGGKKGKTTTYIANSSSSNEQRTDTHKHNNPPEQMQPTEKSVWDEWKQGSETLKKRKQEKDIRGAGNAQSLERRRTQDETEAKEKAKEKAEMDKQRKIERVKHAKDEEEYRHQKFGDKKNYDDFRKFMQDYNK